MNTHFLAFNLERSGVVCQVGVSQIAISRPALDHEASNRIIDIKDSAGGQCHSVPRRCAEKPFFQLFSECHRRGPE